MLGVGLSLTSGPLLGGPDSVPPTPVALTTTVDGEIVIEYVSGAITVTVTSPAEFAGIYEHDIDGLALTPGNLSNGPQCLVRPSLLSDGSPDEGEVISANAGLWLYEDALGTLSISAQWQADTLGDGLFEDISGASSQTYLLTANEHGRRLRLVESADQGAGLSRIAASGFIQVGSVGSPTLNYIAHATRDADLTGNGQQDILPALISEAGQYLLGLSDITQDSGFSYTLSGPGIISSTKLTEIESGQGRCAFWIIQASTASDVTFTQTGDGQSYARGIYLWDANGFDAAAISSATASGGSSETPSVALNTSAGTNAILAMALSRNGNATDVIWSGDLTPSNGVASFAYGSSFAHRSAIAQTDVTGVTQVLAGATFQDANGTFAWTMAAIGLESV